MNRRRLLAAAGAACAGLAGCLADAPPGGTDDPDETATPNGTETPDSTTNGGDYEECDREVIFYTELPDPLRREVDEALAEGEYVADRVHLADAMDVERSYLRKDGDYYDPVVGDGDTRLELRLDESPELPERGISVENDAGETHTVTVTVVASDGELLAEGTVTVDPGDRETVVEVGRVGGHDLHVERDDGERATREFLVTSSHFDGILTVDELEVLQAVADLAPCPWTE